ncbi:MAG: hypothetical protein JWO87_3677 [Phycisphaerales bacterium]|jgi:hypothetical protein|nr:hypothetical protein [Phycisphaerales bacterium]MDB5302859.1 hypothetical protein [Phycisphaerales bacterium]
MAVAADAGLIGLIPSRRMPGPAGKFIWQNNCATES